ncbi:MAG: ankyrin repeat domain-containing protein [Elusimicrobia bacterium]|nr:ankyrin repeat domain-containing protein [Elusimicrobiota bacterium]
MKKFSLILSLMLLLIAVFVLQCFADTKIKEIKVTDSNVLPEDFLFIDNNVLIRNVRRNKIDIVRRYIRNGADIDAKDDNGFFPLLAAVDSNNYDMAKLLIYLGADLDLKTGKIYGKKGIIDYGTALMYSTRLDLYEMSKLLIKSGANLNIQNEEGKTALMIAAERGNEKITKLLISKGADVNIQSVDKMTALSYAARYGKTKIVKILISKGADVNHVHYYGKTPLIEAIENTRYETVKLLIAKGADLNHKNNGYDTTLDIAKRDRNSAINRKKSTENIDKIIKLLEKAKK